LVHEHIEPVNVLAVGETVKLRSDCVRECVADIEFNTPEGCAELRRRDLHDFGMLLVECLTLEKRYNPGLNLPDMFRRLIPHMLDGSWSLEQIGQMLNASAAPAIAHAPNGASAAAANPQRKTAKDRKAEEPVRQEVLPLDEADASRADQQRRTAATNEPTLRARRELSQAPSSAKLRPWLLAGVAGVIVCIFVIWHFVSSKPRQAAVPAAAVAAQSGPAVSAAPSQPALPASVPAAAAPTPVAAHAPGWYVIAYTYNHQGQAQTKAGRLNDRHHGFHAEVFSPRGGAPFLVSLGGPMSESEAKTLQERARRSGLPRDTYIRNYR
ncbi:MAG TPA: SPOR domain-containing protein, partial [Acidobacteriaceae bacterium]